MILPASAGKSFRVLFASGYWAAGSRYGLPDTGIAGLAELVDTFSRYTALAKTPVIADADTGFGDLDSCRMAEAAYRDAGIAAFQIRPFRKCAATPVFPDVLIPLKWKSGSLLQAA